MSGRPSHSALGLSSAVLLAAAALALVDRHAARPWRARIPALRKPTLRGKVTDATAAVRAARRMNRAAGLLAGSVLADSAVEHYRGSFHNKAMIAPLASAIFSLAVSAHGNADKRPVAHRARDVVYSGAFFTGLLGAGFHLFNVSKRPGGFCWQNLFYGAPLLAPAALILSGATGFLSERVRDTLPGRSPTIAGIPAGRAVAAATALGLIGTMGEAGLLHFRGAYHNPFMYAPVSIPPVAAVLIGHAALGRARERRWVTRLFLRLSAAMGFAGVGFHIFGVARNMGGWRNWSQNLLNGPPIPAPPSFTGLALAGLAALGLMEDHPDD
ncbi:MAG TPA: hypothetical protein VIC29_10505 [Steroidobacteraceae bacterium]